MEDFYFYSKWVNSADSAKSFSHLLLDFWYKFLRQAPVQLVLGCDSRWSSDKSARETDLLTGSKFSCSHKECVTFISLPGEEKPHVERKHALTCTRQGVKDLIRPFITDGVIGGTTLRLVPGLTASLHSRSSGSCWKLAAETWKHVCWDYK